MNDADELQEKSFRLRILVIGRAKAGKTTLIKRICNTNDEPDIYNEDGKKCDESYITYIKKGLQKIEDEVVFKNNPGLVFHESGDSRSGMREVTEFIAKRSKEKRLDRQIHVIWYCIPLWRTGSDGIITNADEHFFLNCDTGKVPVITVFTMSEYPELHMLHTLRDEGKTTDDASEEARQYAKNYYENIHITLYKMKHPPKRHVYVREMYRENADCADLVQQTAATLDNVVLKRLLISTQQNSAVISSDKGEQSTSLYNYMTELDDDVVPKMQLPAPEVHRPLGYTGTHRVQCKTANAAYNHAAEVEHIISDVLANSGLDGSYYIQAGFNEELVSSGMDTLEEIYIFLGCKLPTNDDDPAAILSQLRQILAPFLGVVYTPQDTHYILPEEDSSQYLQVAKDAGIYTQGLELAKNHTGGPDAGSSSSNIQGIGSGDGGGLDRSGSESSSGGYRDVGRGGNGHGGGGDDDDDDSDDDDDKHGNNGSNSPDRYRRIKRQEPKSLSIPFASKITIKDVRKESLSTFTVLAVADIKIVQSPSHDDKSKSYPDGWRGPWFGVRIPSVSTSFSNIDTNRGGSYRLSVAQMRVIASSCPCSLLSFSPQDASSIDEPVKWKSERNITGGAWATLSGSPGLKMGGSVSHVSGQETIERRWETMVWPSMGDDVEKWVTWKYVLNERHPNASVPMGTFRPGPEVEFGYKLHGRKPQLEVELVMYWSAFSRSKGDGHFRFRQWFSGSQGKEDAKVPGGFANMLHQVSVCVDLEELASNGWVVNLNPKEADDVKLSDMRGGESSRFEPVKVKADSEDIQLECEVVLRRALHGRIQLRREDRTSDQPLLPSLSQNSTSSSLSPNVILPTPPPSPLLSPRGIGGDNMLSSKAKGKQRAK